MALISSGSWWSFLIARSFLDPPCTWYQASNSIISGPRPNVLLSGLSTLRFPLLLESINYLFKSAWDYVYSKAINDFIQAGNCINFPSIRLKWGFLFIGLIGICMYWLVLKSCYGAQSSFITVYGLSGRTYRAIAASISNLSPIFYTNPIIF